MIRPIDQLGRTRREILSALKQNGQATIAQLSERLGATGEAVRQHLAQLLRAGWVEAHTERKTHRHGGGRPAALYTLTPAGEHLFPKTYETLSIDLVDAVNDRLGPGAVREVLAAVTDSRVRDWASRLEGKSLAERVDALADIYLSGDPYTQVEMVDDGWLLVERNCPFLTAAMERPALCSTTVNALARLLGVRVVREARFQNGDGRCAFRILAGEPVPKSLDFEFEPQPEPAVELASGTHSTA